MQFGPADVKNCVFAHSRVEQVTFTAHKDVLISLKWTATGGVSKCWSDASRFSVFILIVERTSSASLSSDWQPHPNEPQRHRERRH